MFTLEDIQDAEEFLDVQIKVVSAAHFNTVIHSGKERDTTIYLYHHNNHYDAINNMKAFFGSSYYCQKCDKPYNNKDQHKCKKDKKEVCNLCKGPQHKKITESTNIPELSDIKNALILFQKKFNLKPTGEISDETLELINKPRCGVEDHALSFTSHIDKWNKKNIKWYYTGSSKRMKELTEIAFNTWKEHTDLIFEEDQSNCDIIISNKRRTHRKETSGQHFCSKSFDGKGGVLGHAFYPDINNNAVEIHMDQDEDWYFEIDVNTPKEKINFYAVLVHEIGHTLGLAHSTANTSIMYPIYNSSNIELSKDDILGIQSLYGKGGEGNDEDESNDDDEVEEDSNPPELCKLNKKIKNLLIVDKVLYIYYEKWVWVMDLDNLNVHTKPQLISDWLTFLPKGFKNITAAYQRPSGDVVLFIDNKLCFKSRRLNLKLVTPEG
ncbi:stromelysin-1-like [Schistocerca nitens]|uniref:stromelysin-1-like n=1 Tax=Schistocerca nitens TaxID=7011 RepID=UPI0021192CA7|nr:stromelysin-1-like [Schistocerca nitens]